MLAKCSNGAPRLLVSYALAVFGICFCTRAWGQDTKVTTLPKLECTSGGTCGIPVVEPTHAYHNLAEIFVKSKKDRSCVPVPVLAAAFGINVETMDEDSARAALVDAYWRQRNFGENTKLPSLIFDTDKNGTRRPLDAHTVRSLMATELLAGSPQFVTAKFGKNASCVIVDDAAAAQVSACLQAATEQLPPVDACKAHIATIESTQLKPQLAKLLGNIKIGREELTIPDTSLAHIIPRSRYRQESSLGGDKSQPGCVLQFGVRIPEVTEQEVNTLSVKGDSVTANSAVYSCAPDEKGSAQIVPAHDKDIKQTACSGSKLGWDLSGPILGEENTQPFAFLISTPSAEGVPAAFEINLEISTTPKPGGNAGKASWKLTGVCPR